MRKRTSMAEASAFIVLIWHAHLRLQCSFSRPRGNPGDRVSFTEIYMERVRDLLDTSDRPSQNLKVRLEITTLFV